ncbi:MAG: YkgJ family cysteine cluster protein [Sedimentisphaerales bacterium]|nr:YkgJ family cysteine cluster protein [Sedimentisphaerales bacterium]
MKPDLHPETLRRQRYTCQCCGRGCRTFLVPVRPEERRAIEALTDWRKRLGVGELFVKHRSAGPAGYGLAKWTDGRCVFLDDDNLCIIHKLHGFEAKPLACRLFPFVFTPLGDTLRVGLRFDCPGVCESAGQPLTQYLRELNRFSRQIAPAGVKQAPPPKLTPKCSVSLKRFDAVNETLLQIITSDAVPLAMRLHWLHRFTQHLLRIKWSNVPEEDFDDLVAMFKGSLLAELHREKPLSLSSPLPQWKLLRQFFFLVCQPTMIVTSGKKGPLNTLKERLRLIRRMKEMAAADGSLPKIQSDWPDVTLNKLEDDFEPWPDDVSAFITRWLTCRIAGVNYCGPNAYNYSLTEGMDLLLLATVAVGWTMRIAALRAGRCAFALPDAHEAVIIIDGNLGYSQALTIGPSKLRLQTLTQHLDDYIRHYCL